MGFEPTTSTLARLRSTPELRPQDDRLLYYREGRGRIIRLDFLKARGMLSLNSLTIVVKHI